MKGPGHAVIVSHPSETPRLYRQYSDDFGEIVEDYRVCSPVVIASGTMGGHGKSIDDARLRANMSSSRQAGNSWALGA